MMIHNNTGTCRYKLYETCTMHLVINRKIMSTIEGPSSVLVPAPFSHMCLCLDCKHKETQECIDSPSLPSFLSHTHAHTHSLHTCTHTHTHTHSLSTHMYTHTLSLHTCTHTHAHTHSLSTACSLILARSS